MNLNYPLLTLQQNFYSQTGDHLKRSTQLINSKKKQILLQISLLQGILDLSSNPRQPNEHKISLDI
jgi:hypothetical protein